MARQVQFRRGTSAEHTSFTGAVGEVTVDTDKELVVIHDGSTAGGFPIGYREPFEAVTSSTNATTINCRNGQMFSHTLTENTTFTFSNPPASGGAYGMAVKIAQDAGANGYTVTWPASVDWAGGTAPTLTATASAVDVFVFITHDGGTTWYGFTAGLDLQ